MQKIKDLAVSFWKWLVLSSANPQKFSLMIKGILAGAAVYIVAVSNVFGLPGLTVDTVNTVGGDFAAIVEAMLMVVSAIATAYGLIRKVWKTIAGTRVKPM